MTGRTAAWRAVLRLARRDAVRAKGRTALVALMIGLPVLAVATVDVLARSSDFSPADTVRTQLGEAQARLETPVGGQPLLQDPTGADFASPEGAFGGGETATVAGVRAAVQTLLRADADLVAVVEGSVTLRVGDRAVDAVGAEVDSEGSLPGPATLVDGRLAGADDEVAITSSLARHAGLAIGETITAAPRGSGADAESAVTVVGVVDNPGFVREVLGLPGSLFPDRSPDDPVVGAVTTSWFVVGDAPVTWSDVRELNEIGVAAVSRDVLLDPPPRSEVPLYQGDQVFDGSGPSAATVAAVVVVVGLALLEVALLAGPAFAVWARRNRRQLALVAAAGGDRRHVRAVVLAGGLVIGLGASVAGALGGVALAACLRPVLERFEVVYLPSLHVHALDLLALVAVGSLTALAAAVLPAVQASRQDVVAALAGRRGQVRVRRWVPVTGAVVAAAGTAVAVIGAVTRLPYVVLAGAVLAELGLVATTGALVATVARISRHLPVAPRIALRDAARQRSRTAPAVAAVMTAVAGSVAVSLYLTAQDSRFEEMYTPTAPMGTVVWFGGVNYGQENAAEVAEAEAQRAATTLAAQPGFTDVQVTYSTYDPDGMERYVSPITAPEHECPLYTQEVAPTEAEIATAREDPRCAEIQQYGGTAVGRTLVDHGTDWEVLLGDDAPAAERALAAGSAVVGSTDEIWEDGMAHLRVEAFDRFSDGQTETTELVVPAVAADLQGTALIVPSSLLEELDAGVAATGVIASTDGVDDAAVERASAALTDAGVAQPFLYLEQGYTSTNDIGLLALAIAAGVVTLGATGIAVGLAAADSRADLATLAAVGASPRVRRRVAGSQAGVVAILGVLLGVVAGAVLGVVVVLMNRYGAPFVDPTWQVVVPWPQLAAMTVGVPVLAVLSGYLFTRSRLPMVRRLGQ